MVASHRTTHASRALVRVAAYAFAFLALAACSGGSNDNATSDQEQTQGGSSERPGGLPPTGTSPPEPPPAVEPPPQEPPPAATAASGTLRSCGNEGELACGPLERDVFNQECDSGLAARTETCGCLVPNPRGGCLVPRTCQKCRNLTRHRTATTRSFRDSWIAWALRNQREQLAIDEPINWVMHIGTHNSFNNVSDGHSEKEVIRGPLGDLLDAPNHFYSMSDQLDLGVRALALDPHWVGPPENARLCHSIEEPDVIEQALCRNRNPTALNPQPGMRYFANGIKEIANWIRPRTSEILLIDLENRVGDCAGCDGGTAANAYYLDPLREYFGDLLLERVPSLGGSKPFPSRRQLLKAKKRVILFARKAVDDDDKDPADVEFHESLFVSGVFPAWTIDNQDLSTCQDTSRSAGPGSPDLERGDFTVVVEDRTDQRGFVNPPMGTIDVAEMQRLAQCNFSLIFTDFTGSSEANGRKADVPDFSRHAAAVWSWKTNDRGQNGNCAMLERASGRWVSADCAQPHHYACAPQRSESGTNPAGWRMLEDRWHVTESSGPWSGGPAACRAEFPPDEDGTVYVFSVPVNGYQNQALLDANVAPRDAIWMNYTDEGSEGTWRIPRLEDVNSPPVADAGPDRTVECGNEVTLDGSGSVDADGDTLTYTWSGEFGTLTGKSVTTTLPAGEHTITLLVDDGKGETDTDVVVITIADTTAPTLAVSLSPSRLWPPNHQLRKIHAGVEVGDACAADQVQITLVSIVSNEPDPGDPQEDPAERDTSGDHGDKSPDILDAQTGTGDLDFLLRAERLGSGSGRIYTVTYQATDAAGNSAEQCSYVTVPHDNGHELAPPKGC